MDDWPLDTLENAKACYQAYGCNPFYIWKELGDEVAEKFQNLRIPNEALDDWCRESFERQSEKMRREEHTSDSWASWSHLFSLSRKQPDRIKAVIEIGQELSSAVEPSLHVVMAEQILDSSGSVPDSVVSQLSESGERDLAKECLQFAVDFSHFLPGVGMDEERCRRARVACDELARINNLHIASNGD